MYLTSLGWSCSRRQRVPGNQECLARCQGCRRGSLIREEMMSGKSQGEHPQDTGPQMCCPGFACRWEAGPTPSPAGWEGERDDQGKRAQTPRLSRHNSGLAAASEAFHTLHRRVVRHSSEVRECAFPLFFSKIMIISFCQ